MACLDLEGRDVLVVGAGSVALEKVNGLLDVGARVTVVAPRRVPAGRAARAQGVSRSCTAATAPPTSTAAFLVVAATSVTPLNEEVFADADARGMLCNVVDVPELCSFILPAVHRSRARSRSRSRPAAPRPRSPSGYATTSRGSSPPSTRVSPSSSASSGRGRSGATRPTRHVATSSSSWSRAARVTVALVGAGPGDPGLITVRGLELLRARAMPSSTTGSSRPSWSRRRPRTRCASARDGLGQERIDELLVQLGRQGLDVVRLKGGDPYLFGRGGEEALALAGAGIPFEVVPGVSSLAAVPAAAGIPVTHRGVSDAVTLATAHAADGSEPDYEALLAAGGTLVLFMGLGRLGALAHGLVAAGLDPGHRRL